MNELNFDFLFRCRVSRVRSAYGNFQRLEVHLPQGMTVTTHHNGSEKLSWPVVMGLAMERLQAMERAQGRR